MVGERLAAPNVSRGEFARNLAESGLFDAADLLPDTHLPAAPDGATAARALVAAGKLTPYQADALLHRRFSDLRMDNYEILGRRNGDGVQGPPPPDESGRRPEGAVAAGGRVGEVRRPVPAGGG